MRPPGRSTPLPLATIYIILAFVLLNTAQRHVSTFAEPTSFSAIILKASVSEVASPMVSSGTHSSTSTTATTTTTTTTSTFTSNSTHAITSSTLTTQSTPTPSTTPLPRRCKECPANNTKGLTCYKNTQCVPLSLLCNTVTNSTTNITTGTNPCMDTTGPASTVDPIACQDQLCYAKDFLPLPLPGSGKVNRNSSSNCMNGTFFSLYGTPVASGGVVRYTQSCVGQFSTGQTASCSSWEYQAQSSCFLSTCGPGMGCQQPFECRKSSTSSAAQLYGICMSPNSTEDPGDDGDQDSAKDRLIVGLLIGLCGLVLSAGIGTGFWHFRKRRLRQLRLQNGEREDDRVWNEKMSLLSALKVCCDSCFFFGGGSRRRRSDGAATARGTRHVRVVSLAESDSPENPLETDHRSNLIFARRWRWGHGQHAGAGAGVTEGGVAVLPELEPPPLYHQGPELPSYQDRNTILLTPVGPEQAHVVDHSESEGQATLPIPK